MTIETLATRPELRDAIDALSAASWPEFMLHGDNPHWVALFDELRDDQLLFLEGEDLVGVAHTASGSWDGRLETLPHTIEQILVRALDVSARGGAPDTHFALAAMVNLDHRGRGLSAVILDEMVRHAGRRGAGALLAPVRPTWKARYPLTPMESYVRWTRADGLPLDPWLRVHVRRGGEPLAVAPATITVMRDVASWRAWTGMDFPESGSYVVPGALEPVEVDVERDVIRYADPNIWVRHRVRAGDRPAKDGGTA